MARIASFLSRSTLKSLAEEATRFALTHARYESKRTINGIEYKITVDFDLNCVFFDWIDSEYGKKATTYPILKAWGGKGYCGEPDEMEAVAQPVESAPAVEVANEYTAIKLGAPSSLQDLLRNLTVARDVAEMLTKHESIARVNVHSHGPIIADLVELCRRAVTHAERFQREVQGR